MGVLAGLSGAGMKTSLVRQGLLVAGLTIARPAALAIGISRRATQASKGPIIATTLGSAMNLTTFEAPSLGAGRPSGAACEGVGATWNAARTRWSRRAHRSTFGAG